MQPLILRRTVTKPALPFFSILFFCLLHTWARGQCISTNALSGGSFSNDNSVGGSAFASVNNAGSDDGSPASASAVISIFGSARTNLLKATNFGFQVPSSATICGISVWIKKRATGINLLNSISDEQVQLIVGGAATGNDVASGAPWSSTASFSGYGSSSNTWGVSLTPAKVNSPDFGVAIAASYSGLAGVALTAEVDYIMMQVSYTPSVLPLILGPFTTSISGATVTNKWTMYEEEQDGQINLQQSGDGHTWQTINRHKVQGHVGKKEYEVKSKIIANGTWYYRLELVHESGRTTYSRVNSIQYKAIPVVGVYPNPSGDFVNISNAANNVKWRLFDFNGREVRVKATYREGGITLDVRSLNRGSYFIVIENRKLSFLKN